MGADEKLFSYYGARDNVDVKVHTAILPKGIPNADNLMTELYKELVLPYDFEFTWESFSECLKDPAWFNGRNVMLVHQEMPAIDNESLRTYLNILLGCSEFWCENGERRLLVMFPENCREQVGHIITRSI